MKTDPLYRAVWVAAAMLLLGCQAETFGADDHPTLSDATITAPTDKQWPGSEVALHSDGFATLAADAGSFTCEGLEAAAIRVDSTTFRVRLPEGLVAGDHRFTLHFQGDSGTGSIETAGYRGTMPSGAGTVYSDPMPWPSNAPSGVLTMGAGSRLVYTDARTGHSTAFDGAGGNTDGYSIGTSYRSGIAITPSPTSGNTVWLAALDRLTGEFLVDSLPGISGRQVYEISPDTYVRTSSHLTWISGPRGSAYFATESPWFFPMSPDRKYGAFVVNAVQNFDAGNTYGFPVVDLSTGAVARWLPGIGSSDAVAWSWDSRSLYVAARPYWAGTQRIVRVDPETGVELATIATDDGEWWGDGTSWALATDPQRDWLYDLTIVHDHWQLRIRKLDDLTIVSSMSLPIDLDCSLSGSFPALIPDPTGPSVMVVMPACQGLMIHRVDLAY